MNPAGKARPHPALCNTSQPSPPTSLASHKLAARTITDRGLLPSPPRPESIDRWSDKIGIHATIKQASVAPHRRYGQVRTIYREAVRRVEAGTVHCTRTRHGQLRSATHLVLEASVHDDRLWRLGGISLCTVPLTMRPLPSSRSEPDPVQAPFYPSLVQRDLR
jgi:hypothetical protein